MHDYDDPYKIMASKILVAYSPHEIVRILEDDKDYIYIIFRNEIRNMDLSGIFMDGVLQTIFEEKHKVEYNHEIDILARYFFKYLDVERLRGEIKQLLTDSDIFPAK